MVEDTCSYSLFCEEHGCTIFVSGDAANININHYYLVINIIKHQHFSGGLDIGKFNVIFEDHQAVSKNYLCCIKNLT